MNRRRQLLVPFIVVACAVLPARAMQRVSPHKDSHSLEITSVFLMTGLGLLSQQLFTYSPDSQQIDSRKIKSGAPDFPPPDPSAGTETSEDNSDIHIDALALWSRSGDDDDGDEKECTCVKKSNQFILLTPNSKKHQSVSRIINDVMTGWIYVIVSVPLPSDMRRHLHGQSIRENDQLFDEIVVFLFEVREKLDRKESKRYVGECGTGEKEKRTLIDRRGEHNRCVRKPTTAREYRGMQRAITLRGSGSDGVQSMQELFSGVLQDELKALEGLVIYICGGTGPFGWNGNSGSTEFVDFYLQSLPVDGDLLQPFPIGGSHVSEVTLPDGRISKAFGATPNSKNRSQCIYILSAKRQKIEQLKYDNRCSCETMKTRIARHFKELSGKMINEDEERYIGSTERTLSDRTDEHANGMAEFPARRVYVAAIEHLQNDEPWMQQVLVYGVPLEHLKELEDFMIDLFEGMYGCGLNSNGGSETQLGESVNSGSDPLEPRAKRKLEVEFEPKPKGPNRPIRCLSGDNGDDDEPPRKKQRVEEPKAKMKLESLFADSEDDG